MEMRKGRRSGRPDQEGLEELDRRLIETAARLFTSQGYAATSVDQIAADAGAGKQTIYRRYPTKDDLFKAVVSNHLAVLVGDSWTRRTEASAPGHKQSPGSLDALKHSARHALEIFLEPDMIRLHRILISEERLSAVLRKEVEKVALIFEGELSNHLRAAELAGEIPLQSSPYTGIALISMLTGWASRQALLMAEPVSATERDEFFECAWTLFLHGVKGDR